MEFVRAARRREEKAFDAAVDEERVKQGRAPRKPRAKKLWYARCRFWREAERLFEDRDEELNFISDLSLEDRRVCLEKVHAYFLMNPSLQMRGRGSGFVTLGKGPALDAEVDDVGFAYNGSDPQRGRYFKWYRKAVFQDRLRELGWTKRGCKTGADVHGSVTERQCMLALHLMNQHLGRFPVACAMLDEYAGPQCYPQLAEDAKYQANEVRAPDEAAERRRAGAGRGARADAVLAALRQCER